MNVSNLEVPPPQQVQRTSNEASDKDADFLSLRLLNKRARVRLSPEPLDLQPLPGKAQLFSVTNSRGWFVAAIRNAGSDISLIFSPLSDLRVAFSNAAPENAEAIFVPKRTLSFAPATPNIVVFASADTRLIVGLTQGPVLVFDTARLFAPGSDEIAPLHSFPSTTSSAPRLILPNPGDMPDLVAILRDTDGNSSSQLVEILDVQKMESVGGWRGGDFPDATPTSLSWSPKGKQIAVGLQSGDIITFSPTETNKPKLVFGKPPSANNQSVIAMTWLSNPTIHTIYASPGQLQPDAQQTHIVLSLDVKKNQTSDVKLTTPYFPSPAIRSPGSFTVVLKNWEPTKFILIIGDSSSSDIGIIGGVGDDAWYNFSLEETSTPSLPLDKDMNDTVLVALELDLTSTESYHHAGSGEPSELPPPPIMYAYASDGTVLGWYIVNSQGQAYPGMVSGSASTSLLSVPAMSSSISQNDMQMSSAPITPVSGPTSAFGQQPASQSAFGQFAQPQQSTSAFGSSLTPSAFGQSSAFGRPSQAPSAFGQQQQPLSAFGQPSAFSQAVSSGPFEQASGPPFGANTSSGGFSAFSSAGPAKFGQGAFGFGTSPSPTLQGSVLPSAPPPPAEDSMAADDGPSFGGLSLGDTSQTDKPASTFGSASIFGNATMPLTQNSDATNQASAGSSSGGFSAIKPATGFGAFANLNSQSSGFGSVPPKDSPTSPEVPKPSSAFGKSGFEIKPPGSFGQSAFGQSGFGQSSGSVFGKSSFGAVNTPAAGVSGFSTFAASGTSSFASAVSQVKPEQPITGGFGAFAQKGSSFTSAIPQKGEDSKPVWVSTQPSSEDNPALGAGTDNRGGVFEESLVSDSKSVTGSGAENSESTASAGSAGQTAFGMIQVKDEPEDNDLPRTPKHTSPANLPASPTSSPESLPANKGLSPFGKIEGTTSVSSPFKSSAPSSGTGAFGQLKTSSTGFFKPAEGFGAFGSVVNKDSPFYNPPKAVGTKPLSVFSSSPTPASTPPKTGSTTPAFGSPTGIGSSKPTFGSTSTLGSTSKTPPRLPAAAVPTSEPSSGGFSAFGNKSGFATFAGTATSSFGDLLRGGEEAKDPSKPKMLAIGTLSKDSVKPPVSVFASEAVAQEKQSSQLSVDDTSSSKASTSGSPAQETSETPSTPAKSQDSTALLNSPQLSLARIPLVPDVRAKEPLEEMEVKGEGKDPVASSGGFYQSSLGSSLASVSATSQSSSFVDVSAPSDEEDSASRPEIPDRPTDSGSDLEDDTQSFLSESFSDESPDDELSDEETGEEDEDRPRPRSVSPDDPVERTTDVLLFSTSHRKSRSPSTTPKPEPSNIQLPKSPSPQPISPAPTKSSTSVRAGSTTPPGSPSPPEPSSASLPKAPLPGSVPSAPSPLGLGLGRPSTRPTRSSPLASVPLSSNVDETSGKAVSSRSAPSIIPKPASPKQPFGFWETEQTQKSPASVDSKVSEPSHPKRPKTPPLLSVGIASAKLPIQSTHPSSSPMNPSTTSPSPSTSASLGAAPAGFSSDTSVGQLAAPAPLASQPLSLFGDRSTAPSPATPLTSGGVFGRPLLATPVSSSPIPNFFNQKRTTSPSPVLSSAAAGSFDGKTVALGSSSPAKIPVKKRHADGSSSGPSLFGGQQHVVVAPAPPVLEPGMQAECASLFVMLNKELDQLRQYAQRATSERERLAKPTGHSHHKVNLADRAHWTMGDTKTWGLVLKALQHDIEQLEENRRSLSQSLRELESSMLRAGTKKEEIARFNRAKTDPEFAKMLKIRTLGPEHLETQSQLRRDIRAMRDRIQKLEDHFEASKKKLNQVKAGKPALRAPSLDIINRTYRNIDIAVDHQAQQVTQLTSRLKKLKLSSNQQSLSQFTRDNRLPDPKRPYNPTPSVVINAVNALNGEVSAQRLKRALLSVRQQPLLNTKAIATSAPLAFNTPQKQLVKSEPRSPILGPGLQLASPSPSMQSPAWNPMPFDDSPLHELSPRRREKAHKSPYSHRLRKDSNVSPSASASPSTRYPPTPSFDWGPLPVIAPTKELPFSFSKLPASSK